MSAITPLKQEITLMHHALAYAARGIPVFPCKPSGDDAKRPFTKNGFKDATTDQEQIRAWWTKWPDALIGMPTGQASCIWVLDIDVPSTKNPDRANGFTSYEYLIKDRETPNEQATQQTPSGGQHFFFRMNTQKKLSGKNLGSGLDVKETGGYVCLAPSVIHDYGAYSAAPDFLDNVPDAPEWLIELASGGTAEIPQLATNIGADGKYGRKALEEECAKLAATPSGEGNITLNECAFRIGQLVGKGHINRSDALYSLLDAIKGWKGLNQRKSTDTINRALDAGEKEPRGPEPAPVGKTEGNKKVASAPVPTEDILASLFTARYKGKFLFCHDTGAWYEWDGVHWRKDRTRNPLHLMRLLCRENNDDGKPVLGKLVTASGSLKFASGDPEMKTTSEIWDADPWLIGTPGGPVDLRTGALTPATPEQRITKLAGVAPAETADCPLWYRFLDEATGGDEQLKRFMQQIAGYCLTGVTLEHALFFIYGPGGNGKSVFLNILNAVLADYATTSALTTFTASQNDQHPTEFAMLRGARLVSVSETEDGRAWAESRIKQLTGGDKITARFMRQDFFEYVPQFKLVIIGNHQPILRNVDDAARRRFNIIPFVHKPEHPDIELEKKLMAELPAIFRWAIEGCLDWQRNGLVRPDSVIAATQEYFDTQDLFGRWIEDECERIPKAWTATRTLYESWKKYAERSGEQPGDIRKFGPMLTRAALLPLKSQGHRGYKGIRVRQDEDRQDYNDR